MLQFLQKTSNLFLTAAIFAVVAIISLLLGIWFWEVKFSMTGALFGGFGFLVLIIATIKADVEEW